MSNVEARLTELERQSAVHFQMIQHMNRILTDMLGAIQALRAEQIKAQK